jgi:hypothetical protein
VPGLLSDDDLAPPSRDPARLSILLDDEIDRDVARPCMGGFARRPALIGGERTPPERNQQISRAVLGGLLRVLGADTSEPEAGPDGRYESPGARHARVHRHAGICRRPSLCSAARRPLTHEVAVERVAASSRTMVMVSDPGKGEGRGKLARAWRHLKCGFRCYFVRIFGKG